MLSILKRWRVQVLVILSLICAASGTAHAAEIAPSSNESPMIEHFLRKVQNAALRLDYVGNYVHQQGDQVYSAKLTHRMKGSDEQERLEILDGEPREFLRQNEELHCYVPSKRLLMIERQPMRDRFPALLSRTAGVVARHYDLHSIGRQRIAGRACEVHLLLPKDDRRYGYRLCSDAETGLLMKLQTVGRTHQVIEQIAFTHIDLTHAVNDQAFKIPWRTADWKTVKQDMGVNDTPGFESLADAGWRWPGLPSGFESVKETTRRFAKSQRSVRQLMLSDGLATVSVFVEADAAEQPDLVDDARIKGALHIVTRRHAGFRLTVLGEAPPATLNQIAEAFVLIKPPAAGRLPSP